MLFLAVVLTLPRPFRALDFGFGMSLGRFRAVSTVRAGPDLRPRLYSRAARRAADKLRGARGGPSRG